MESAKKKPQKNGCPSSPSSSFLRAGVVFAGRGWSRTGTGTGDRHHNNHRLGFSGRDKVIQHELRVSAVSRIG
jgi:hypothetical protein